LIYKRRETMEILMTKQQANILATINQYGKQLINFIRGKVPTKEDAEDVIQDVWHQLSSLNEIDKLDSMSGWLYRVAKNKITDKFRKKKTQALEDFTYETEEGEISFKEILLADTHTPEDEYIKNLFWDELMNGLDELPEKQRDVFILNELEDISLQQIADQTNENIKTIISRKGYAVKFLRERLKNLYHDFFEKN